MSRDVLRAYDAACECVELREDSLPPEGWPSWPLKTIVSFPGIKTLPPQFVNAIRKAVTEGRMPLPALDRLPESERHCHETLAHLAREIATTEYFVYDRPTGVVRLNADATANFLHPAVFATELARCGARNKGRFCTSMEKWTEAPERVFESCIAWGSDGNARVTNKSINREAWWRGGRVPKFPTSAACAIYTIFRSRRVLDLSAGWGDRLAAAIVTPGVEAYVGIDPNVHVHSGYARLARGASLIPGKDPSRFRCICVGADAIPADANLGEEMFDTMFTSPPFWDQELYDLDAATNAGQSVVAYPTHELWTREFWPRYVDAAIRRLAPGGKLALDMHDAPSKTDTWVSDARRVLDSDSRISFSGILRYAKTGSSLALPIWIWTKRLTTP